MPSYLGWVLNVKPEELSEFDTEVERDHGIVPRIDGDVDEKFNIGEIASPRHWCGCLKLTHCNLGSSVRPTLRLSADELAAVWI